VLARWNNLDVLALAQGRRTVHRLLVTPERVLSENIEDLTLCFGLNCILVRSSLKIALK